MTNAKKHLPRRTKGRRLKLGEIVVESTGFHPNDRIKQFVARCYLKPSFEGLRFEYGDTEAEAEAALNEALT